MFLKIMGAIVILISSYLCGLYFAEKSAFRNQDLEQLKKALTIFKGELIYSSAPMAEVFKEISERTTGIVSLLFDNTRIAIEKRNGEGISEIWNGRVADISKNAYFSPEDMEYIFSFGRTLGYADKNQQADNARLLIEYIDTAQVDLRQKRATEEKLYKTLGIMGGLMVSIVLF